jgi:septal ring factor EnvC (AmiA/AmiB activator)
MATVYTIYQARSTQAENATLKAKIAAFKAENATLRAEIAAFKAENVTLWAENAAFKERIERQEAKNEQMQKDINLLLGKHTPAENM